MRLALLLAVALLCATAAVGYASSTGHGRVCTSSATYSPTEGEYQTGVECTP